MTEPKQSDWYRPSRGSGLVRHGACGKVWWQSGEYTSHCGSSCHETFSSLQGFDAHRAGGSCAHPSDITDDDGRRVFSSKPAARPGETIGQLWTWLPPNLRPAAE